MPEELSDFYLGGTEYTKFVSKISHVAYSFIDKTRKFNLGKEEYYK